MIKYDLEEVVNNFRIQPNPTQCYTSFDYCYNYFRNSKHLSYEIEISCLVLGFYLASWGMYRGSSFLLQKSVKHFEPVIQYISSLDKIVWEIDVDNYDEKNIHKILEIYKNTKNCVITSGNADITLITKISLGVFGFIPAFDNYFCNTFREIYTGQCGFRAVNEKSLTFIKKFYVENTAVINKLSSETFTTDFATGEKTVLNYPKAKIIDMYGFFYGQ